MSVEQYPTKCQCEEAMRNAARNYPETPTWTDDDGLTVCRFCWRNLAPEASAS